MATKVIKQESLRRFINVMEKNGAPKEAIVDQLKKFLMGERGIGMCDACIHLIDGEMYEPGDDADRMY